MYYRTIFKLYETWLLRYSYVRWHVSIFTYYYFYLFELIWIFIFNIVRIINITILFLIYLLYYNSHSRKFVCLSDRKLRILVGQLRRSISYWNWRGSYPGGMQRWGNQCWVQGYIGDSQIPCQKNKKKEIWRANAST